MLTLKGCEFLTSRASLVSIYVKDINKLKCFLNLDCKFLTKASAQIAEACVN